MSNSSGVEFIDENASEDVGTSLYQVKRFPTEKVPKIISLVTKMGVPEKYAERVAFAVVTVVLGISLYGIYGNLFPPQYKPTKEQMAKFKQLMPVDHPPILNR